jgi:alkyldihydroxyacetonephosphate synthase
MGFDHEELTARLAEAVGAGNVSRTPRELAAAGVPVGAGTPAWLVRPGAAAEIAEVLRLCSTRGAQVVPVGTASRRRGERRLGPPLVVVDMKRMHHVLHLDEMSLVVHAQAGLTGLALEELLLPRGLSLGDFPPAAMRSTLGGMLAVRTPGKSTPRHGFLEDAVLGLSAVLADGRTIHTRVAPRRATGPDLARALLGSEGTLGVIASVVLRIHRRAETRVLDAWRVPSVATAVDAVAAAFRQDVRPGALRIYDHAEALAHLGPEVCGDDEAVVVCACAGAATLVQVERKLLAAAMEAQGGSALPVQLAETWWRRRTGHSVGGLSPPPPSLEFAATPTRLAPAYAAIIAAARKAGRRARAHISRFDDDGAVIFVTLLDGERADASGPARDLVVQAARSAGALAPGERDPALQPYFDALKVALDPRGALG